MSLTQMGRYSTLGVWVCFRLEGTEELLWKAPMQVLPRVDDYVGHMEGGSEVDTQYKVERVLFEFDRDPPGTFGDPPQEFTADHSHFGVCCMISEVLP